MHTPKPKITYIPTFINIIYVLYFSILVVLKILAHYVTNNLKQL